MMVTKNPQNVHRKYFWAILVTFIFDIKIDVNICEPHYVNLFLGGLSLHLKKNTLKPPYSIASECFLSAILDISHWNFFVKFGLKTA